MPPPASCQILGRWRIVSADLWDRDYLDLCGPAMLEIGANGHGTLTFGVLQGDLLIDYSRTLVWFRLEGDDDGHAVSGDGCADLQDDSTLEITLTFHNGDEAVLTATRPGPPT